ncbi:hypothetical protein A4X13_0g5626 [Tilletia indica]|uniref:Uncharacterized protein n=1 Tax=Tilletia indica TaxID=43049 RepID=A0A177TLA2_9BASI|nr:hypothetical protein A4X13_0g5626 [Tilletia indica]
MVNFSLSTLFLLASTAILAVKAAPADPYIDPQTANPPPGTFAPRNATTWFQTASANADNSTVTLNEGGQGTIDGLGKFYANSGVKWNMTALEVGFAAGTNETNTLGGGYTITEDGISVGAGITFLGRSVDFSLSINKDGTITSKIGGTSLNCSGSGSSASCNSA